MHKSSYISKILLAIIPLLLLAGYFERYLTLLPQYFYTGEVYAYSNLKTENFNLNLNLAKFESVPLTLIERIGSLEVDEWKVKRVQNYLKNRGAPLASKAKFLVQSAKYYRIDYRLVAAISIIESSGGRNTYRPYNAWGWGGAEAAFTFRSWEEAIMTVSRGLAGYYAGGANTPAEIAPRYNPHTPKEWSRKVTFVMSQM
ncbi:hypothetical protein IT417_00880 [bacterium]|nr:hypothetical protein [bacterium]